MLRGISVQSYQPSLSYSFALPTALESRNAAAWTVASPARTTTSWLVNRIFVIVRVWNNVKLGSLESSKGFSKCWDGTLLEG